MTTTETATAAVRPKELHFPLAVTFAGLAARASLPYAKLRVDGNGIVSMRPVDGSSGSLVPPRS